MATLDITTGQSCEPDKLIVEIVGEVPVDYVKQRVLIYTEKGQYSDVDTDKLEREPSLTHNALTSTLHTWERDGWDRCQLYLEIATENGAPIRLPLMKNAVTTPRQNGIHTQNNLIVPVVPMTTIKKPELLSFKPEYTKITGMPVLCRAGWFYIFYQGKLWREVQIQQNQTTGETTYHDTRLSFDENGNLKDTNNYQRQAVGVALTEIWLPARCNGQQQTVQVFYSEAQLCALRLNYLQNNPNILSKRSHAIAMTPQAINPAKNSLQQYRNQPFLLKTANGSISNHIPRNITTESHLNDPTAFLLDTTGQYLTQEFSKAAEKLKELDQDEYQPLSDTELRFPAPNQFAREISLNAYSYQLKEILFNKAQAAGSGDKEVSEVKYRITKEEDNHIWRQQPLTTPVLTGALDKAICGLYVADPIFDIRYREQQIHDGQELQKFIAERASLRKQHGNAILVNNLMYASRHIDKANPLYQATKQLSKRGWSKVSFALAEDQRTSLNYYITDCQNSIYEIFNSEPTVEAFKDLTSLYGIDYLANCRYLLEISNLIAEPAELTDPLSDAMYKKPEPTRGYALLTGLFKKEANSPYYGLLFDAEYNLVELLNDYQAPTDKPARRGDGGWYPYEIASLLDQPDTVLNPENAMSLQGAYFAGRFASGVENFLTVSGNLAASIYGYIDILEANIKKGLLDIEQISNGEVVHETSLLEEEQRKLNALKEEEAHIKTAQQNLQDQQKQLESAIKTNQSRHSSARINLRLELEKVHQIDLTLRQKNQHYQEYLARWRDKTPATISDQQILSWEPGTNQSAHNAKQIVMNIQAVRQEIEELHIQHRNTMQQLKAKTDELAAKNSQIAEVQAKIEQVQQSPASNKRLRFSLTQRHQFISAQTARELLDKDIGLRLDETNKPLPPERIVLGADPQAVPINGTSVIDIVESNRQKLHNATASIIKIENGVPVAPQGVSPKKVTQAVAQGNTVLVTSYMWTVAGNKKFWRTYERELKKLRPKLNELMAEANGMATQQTAFLRSVEQVEADISAKRQRLEQLQTSRQQTLHVDYENQQAARSSLKESWQQRIEANENANNIAREINERAQIDSAQQQEYQTNQRDLEQLEQTRQANSAQQSQSYQTIDGHQTAIKGHHAIGAVAAKDLIEINSRSGFRTLDRLATQDGRLQSLNATRNRIDILGPLLPAFILALEIRNIVSLTDYEKQLKENGAERYTFDWISAGLNTAAAFDLLGAKLITDQEGRYNQLMNARAKTAPPLPKTVEERLGISFISRRLWLQGIAASASVILSAWDLYKAIGSRDPAKITGYSAITAGSAAILVSTILSGGASGVTLLGLTAGWWLALGFALFAGGYFIISAFTYTPFEEWIKNGPFADDSNGGLLSRTQYPHLENPANEQEAFYRLVSLIAAVQVEFAEVQYNEWALLSTGYAKPEQAVRLSIRTSLPGLLNNPSAYSTIADVKLAYGGASSFKDGIDINSYFQQNTPDGVNLYFDLLNDAKKAYEANRLKEAEALRYRGYQGEIPEPAGWSAVCAYVLRLQIRVLDKNNKQWVYPAPLPLQNTQFDANKHGKLPLFYHFEPEPFWLKKYDKFRRVGESNGIN